MSSLQHSLSRFSLFAPHAGSEAAWQRAREQGARPLPQMSAQLVELESRASALATRADLPVRTIAADLLSRS